MTLSDRIVLLVEDDPDGQEVVVGLLGHVGIQVEVVDTAEAALSDLSMRNYQAVIIDLALPRMDGLTLLSHIRGNPETAQLPCIVITAYDSSLVKKQAIQTGCDVYLVKPLQESYLFDALSRVFSDGRAAE